MKEQTFKFKIEIFGVQRIANVKATTLEEARTKLDASILAQMKILTIEYKKPTTADFVEKFNEMFGDIFSIRGKK